MVYVTGTLKKCCPTLEENHYHLRSWHPGEILTFEADDAKCKVCDGFHDYKRCPFIHPLNRVTEEPKKFKGATCWCGGGKHLGIDGPGRTDYDNGGRGLDSNY